MPHEEPTRSSPARSRLPVALTVVAVLLLLAALPARVRVAPNGALVVAAVVVLVPMLGVSRTRGSARWLRAERMIVLFFCAVMGTSSAATLCFVVRAMLRESAASSGLVLLSSGTAVWITNLLVFTLLYWQLDRGGPEKRENGADAPADWLFPQASAPEDAPSRWRPSFVDYLALGFTTATAFSPADVLPLTPRAKTLMMAESLISLVTIVVVGARAINVLKS